MAADVPQITYEELEALHELCDSGDAQLAVADEARKQVKDALGTAPDPMVRLVELTMKQPPLTRQESDAIDERLFGKKLG